MEELNKQQIEKMVQNSPDLQKLQEHFMQNPTSALKTLWEKYFYPAMFQDKKIELIEVSLIDFAKIMDEASETLKNEVLYKGTLWGAVIKMNPTLLYGMMLVKVGEGNDSDT